MARKTRKRRRRSAGAAPVPPRPRPEPVQRRTARGEAPAAPWGSFPLVELVVLAAIVFLAAGFFISGTRGAVMIGTGLVLGSLAGLELSIREHLAGYRSHTMVLAGAIAVLLTVGLSALAPSLLSPPIRLALGAAVFASGLYGFRELFKRRSGGAAFRVGGFGG